MKQDFVHAENNVGFDLGLRDKLRDGWRVVPGTYAHTVHYSGRENIYGMECVERFFIAVCRDDQVEMEPARKPE